MFKEYCKNCNIEIIFKRKCDHSRFLNGSLFLCLKCYKKHHYYKNHTNTLSIKKKWRDNNKEKQSTYQLLNKKRIREKSKKWYKENYNKVKEYRNKPEVKLSKKNCDHKRRCKINNSIKDEDLINLYNNQNVCIYCNREMQNVDFDHNIYKTLDHIIPLSRGGKHSLENIQIICFKCNASKNNKTHEEFINYIKTCNNLSYVVGYPPAENQHLVETG